MQNQKSAIGLDGNVTALIGYIIGIIALVEIFIEKDNRFARFHAIQAVLFHVAMWVLFFVVWIAVVIIGIVFSMISNTLGSIVWALSGLIFLVWFLALIGGIIMGALKSYQGNMFKFPIIGNLAEKWT
jgi:uncharacterized membrane protein